MSSFNPTAPLFPQFPMPFDFTTLNTNQLANKYYNNTALYETKGLKVYADDESSSQLQNKNPEELDEVIVYSNQSYLEFNDFDLVLFTHKDGVTLLEQFNIVEAGSNEIVVFLELDSKVNFGKVMRIKVGSGVLGKKELPYSDIITFAQGKSVNISPKRLKKLLKQGVQSKKSLFKWILSSLAEEVSEAVQFITGGIGDVFFKHIPKFIDENLRISEKGWNPDADNFKTFLIPDVLEKKLEELQGKSKAEQKIIDAAITPFFKQAKALEKQSESALEKMKHLIPNKVYRKIKKGLNYVFNQIDGIEAFFKDPEYGFFDIVLKNLRLANALLCGLWNSIVDIVNGIFQIIGLVFLGIKEATDFAENAGYYAALSIEFMENVVEDILEIDFLELFKQFLFLPIQLVGTVVKFTGKAAAITLEQVYYFVGYLVGFIVETIMGILFTGGTLNVSKVLVKTFKEPVELLLKGIKNVAETATSLINKIIQAVKAIFKALKNPKQLIQDFIIFIEDLLGVGKNAVDEFDSIIDDVLNGKKKIDSNKRKGNFGEIVAHKEIASLKKVFGKDVKYEPLIDIVADLDETIKKGIDGLYINKSFSPPPPPHKYLVNEAKFNTAKLNKTITKSGASQMMEEWITYSLKNTGIKRSLIRDILNGYDPVLTTINKNGSLKSMKLLDDNAKSIKNIN